MTTAFPLHWPHFRPRTPAYAIERSRFKVSSFAVARDNLVLELSRLGAKSVVISTNIPLRGDGLPYATYRKPGSDQLMAELNRAYDQAQREVL